MEKMTSRVAPKEDAIPWGLLTSLDIYGCNPEIIRDAEIRFDLSPRECDFLQRKFLDSIEDCG